MTTTNTETPQDQTWGNQIQPKAMQTIRLLLQNIRGLDLTSSGSIKLAALRSFTQVNQVDVCTITECNVD